MAKRDLDQRGDQQSASVRHDARIEGDSVSAAAAPAKKAADRDAADAAARRMASGGGHSFTRPWEQHPLLLEAALDRMAVGGTLDEKQRVIVASYFEDHPEKRGAATAIDGEPEIVSDQSPAEVTAKGHAIERWMDDSATEIHNGLENALLSKIVGKVNAEGADVKKKVCNEVEDQLREKLVDMGKDALTKRPKLSTKGAGKAVRSAASGLKSSASGAGELAALAPVVGTAIAVTGKAKEVSEEIHEVELQIAEANNLTELVHGVQSSTRAYFGNLKEQLWAMSPEAIAAIDPGRYAKPMITAAALAFWFERIVEEAMIATGVMHHDEIADSVQTTLHPAPEGE